MRRVSLNHMTEDQLVQRFAAIAIAQDEANLYDDIAKYNTLYQRMEEVDQELRGRGREARLALVSLYTHPNTQVRLKAAVRTLGVAPDQARAVLEAIRQSRTPQALDAGMTIRNLNSGLFKPT